MITNAQYLIQRYAEAREKMQDANTENGRFYWKGAMDTYHAILNESFSSWATTGSVGYYVFYENMGYDAAHAHIARLTRDRIQETWSIPSEEEGVLRDL